MYTFFSWGLFIFVEAVEMSRQIVFAICRVAAKWTGVDSATQFWNVELIFNLGKLVHLFLEIWNCILQTILKVNC